MRVALILTTAGTFLAHALLGCCWHHVHAAPAGVHASPAGVVSTHVASACGHPCGCPGAMGVADEPTDDEAPPTAPTSCDEPGCVFVTTVPSSFSAELPVTGWPTINWPAINWAVILPHQVAAPAELNELAGLRAFGADSMRSHLALGVLRI